MPPVWVIQSFYHGDFHECSELEGLADSKESAKFLAQSKSKTRIIWEQPSVAVNGSTIRGRVRGEDKGFILTLTDVETRES